MSNGMQVIPGGGKRDFRAQAMAAIQARRRALLAIVHIARKDLGMSTDQYEALLSRYRVESAAKLTIIQLEDVIDQFKKWGWRPKRSKPSAAQAAALHERAHELARLLENGEKRLAGLCRRICGVRILEWCKDVQKLEHLLKALGEITRQTENERSAHE